MRNWNGFDNDVGIYDHVIRHLPRDYQIFERMNPGDEYPAAHKVAMTIFDERLRALARRGTAPKPGSAAYNELKKTIVPPYDPTKFANKWRKLDAREPSRTITAHIGKDSYSHIHYADDQARTISVREAARLQSFPDGFRFAGTLDPALKQIGNSVPPLFAAALAEAINQQLATHAIVTKRRA
jgi:DNA (cytosine-5)-methyltransferase 1